MQKAAFRSPNTVAFVERFTQTLQQECLEYFIVFGERHVNHLVREMVACYHESRPHQAKDNEPLVPAAGAKGRDEPARWLACHRKFPSRRSRAEMGNVGSFIAIGRHCFLLGNMKASAEKVDIPEQCCAM